MTRLDQTKRNARVAWKLQAPARCMGCNSRWQDVGPLEIHEIERRSHSRNWAHPCNYLLLCQECHAGKFATMPHAQQLAHKLKYDPLHFDLDHWLRIRDPELRAPNRVTMDEIMEAIRTLNHGSTTHAA